MRRRLVQKIESARQESAARRQAADRATADYGPFLENVATPVFRHLVMALRAYRDNRRQSSAMHTMSLPYSDSVIDSIASVYAAQPAK